MPRGANGDKADALIAARQLVDHGESGPGGELGEGPGVVSGVGVLVDVAAALVAEGAQFVEVGAVVHAEQLEPRRRALLDAH